jgi:hypothetical protein
MFQILAQGATMITSRHSRVPLLVLLLGPVLVLSAAYAQNTSDANDYIAAGFIAEQLRAMGLPARIDKDDSGDPRVNTKVDGHDWSIYFYDCAAGDDLEKRSCQSYQFYSGYLVPNSFPLATLNKWNTEKRYLKAYLYQQRDRTYSAHIEIDVLVNGTGADPARTFQAYFTKMKNDSEEFRKAIGAK